MEQSNPSWYEALQGNPLNGKTFSEQTAAAIKLRARGRTSVKMFPRFMIAAAASLSVVMLSLIAYNQLYSPAISETEGQQAAAPGSSAAEATAPDTVPTDDKLYSIDVPADQLLFENNPTDGEWLAFVNELEESKGYDQYYHLDKNKMLASMPFNENEHYVFTINMNDIGVLKLSFYVFEWGSKWAPLSVNASNKVFGTTGWKQTSLITHRFDEQNREQIDGFHSEYYRMNDLSIFVGLSVDPNVSQVRITDNNNNVYFSEIVANEDGFTYWHAATDVYANSFTLESLDAEGNPLYTKKHFLR